METTPLLDYRTSVAAWGHSLSSRLRPSRAYCLVSTVLTLGPHPWVTPTSESIYLRTFKAPPPALKDFVNWLEIDFTDITRLYASAFRRKREKLNFRSNRMRMNLIVRFNFTKMFEKVVYIFSRETILYVVCCAVFDLQELC